MVPIQNIYYSIKESPEKKFSRLDWAVRKVGSIEGQMFQDATVETSKPWIGELNQQDFSLRLIEPREKINFIRKYVPIVVKGKIIGYKNGSIVEIKLRFSLITLIILLAVYSLTIYKVLDIFIHDLYEQTGGAIIMYAIIPIFLTIVLKVLLNKVEEKLDFLFRD